MGIFNVIKQAFGFTPQEIDEPLNVEDSKRHQPEIKLPQSLVDAIGNAVEEWERCNRPANSSNDLERERQEMHSEIQSLRKQVGESESLKKKLEQSELSKERQKRAMTDRIIDLQNRLAEQEAKTEQLVRGKYERGEVGAEPNKHVEEELAKAKEEIARLTTLNEQLDMKSRMSDKMLGDLNAQLQASTKENKKLREDMAVVEDIQEQMTQIEEVMKKKNDRIETLESEAQTLKKTIETNLYNQAHSENRLRREIKDLQAELDKIRKEDQSPRPERRSRRKSPSLEDEISNAECFGYHEPKRTPEPDDDLQMSLF